ncbi:hypothetical protein P6B95_17475 [Streptomyces atratus]|uniref:hypothetical protein n=1 Tax=Streptomyces atratus TaxID=1893 RepID=UPI0016714CE6|nr:hypothetical protein [Streptomyces atratus]WPW28999.1 hypothetical protein P6B95_17475 [Streptomyces atratus]GGT11140.1 hypothetical protein GCM10010207_07370 [Streptomyces atratus]
MHNKMRMTAAALTAVLALGVAAPAASAADTGRSRVASTASALQTAPTGVALTAGVSNGSAATGVNGGAASLGTQTDVGTKGISGAAKKLVDKIVKSKYGKSAIKAAKKGRKAFKKWVDSLSNFNPLKWVIKAAPAYVIDEVISYLISHF